MSERHREREIKEIEIRELDERYREKETDRQTEKSDE